MTTAKQEFDAGSKWTDETVRAAFPILIRLALTGRKLTYGELEQEVAARLHRVPLKKPRNYRHVLEKIGEMLNRLSSQWNTEIPPLTILIINQSTKLPSSGVDNFLRRYVARSTPHEQLTKQNRRAMIERTTEAVYNYARWREVASNLGIMGIGELSESEPIPLPIPNPIFGGESNAHLELKEYIAKHPELFVKIGQFGQGKVEALLLSGDEVDVLFRNSDQTLAIEVKTADAPAGELTRGIFQAVKYRAVLRAMHDVAGELCNVKVVLVTPQSPLLAHKEAAKRLDVEWQQIHI